MKELWRRALQWLWHPLPFISESVSIRILWLMPLVAFLLFLGLVASLSAYDS